MSNENNPGRAKKKFSWGIFIVVFLIVYFLGKLGSSPSGPAHRPSSDDPYYQAGAETGRVLMAAAVSLIICYIDRWQRGKIRKRKQEENAMSEMAKQPALGSEDPSPVPKENGK